MPKPNRIPRCSLARNKLSRRSFHDHRAEHASLHVIEQVAVISPLTRRVGADQIAKPFARLDIDRVFVRAPLAVAVFQLTPEPVEMDRMLHHGVVYEDDAYPFSQLQPDRLGAGEF